MQSINAGGCMPQDEFVFSLVKEKRVKQIGRGKFGAVFATPDSDTVIKVCQDDAYQAYVYEVIKPKNKTNPWFPRIKSATLYEPSDSPSYFVVEMERLRKGSPREVRATVALLDERLDDIVSIAKVLRVDTDKMRDIKRMRGVLQKLFKSYGPDFHAGNIMFRGDDHAVIIDPAVSGDYYTSSRR